MDKTTSPYQYRWRDYRTASGRRPVAEFIRSLPLQHREAIAAAMKDVRREGLGAAQRVTGDVWEVRAQVRDAHYRLLFAPVTKFVFLLLLVFDKNDRKLRINDRELAQRRLRDWQGRGQ